MSSNPALITLDSLSYLQLSAVLWHADVYVWDACEKLAGLTWGALLTLSYAALPVPPARAKAVGCEHCSVGVEAMAVAGTHLLQDLRTSLTVANPCHKRRAKHLGTATGTHDG
eukprot:6782652-Prymnesium_polylepis.1